MQRSHFSFETEAYQIEMSKRNLQFDDRTMLRTKIVGSSHTLMHKTGTY